MSSIRTNRSFILILIITAVIGSASENGVAEEQNKDRTGSPDGSATCTQCHNSGNFNLIVDYSVRDVDGLEVSSYVPGETYDLRFMMITIAGPSASAYGFQTTALFSDLSDAGTYSMPGTNVQLEEVNNEDIPTRHIAEHSQPNPSGIFDLKWTAPEEDAGDVTFYYAATAVDLDEDNSGDNGVNGVLTLPPALPDALVERSLSDLPIRWTDDGLSIDSDGSRTLDELRIYDLNGRLLLHESMILLPATIPFVHHQGIALVEMTQGAHRDSKKVLRSK